VDQELWWACEEQRRRWLRPGESPFRTRKSFHSQPHPPFALQLFTLLVRLQKRKMSRSRKRSRKDPIIIKIMFFAQKMRDQEITHLMKGAWHRRK